MQDSEANTTQTTVAKGRDKESFYEKKEFYTYRYTQSHRYTHTHIYTGVMERTRVLLCWKNKRKTHKRQTTKIAAKKLVI